MRPKLRKQTSVALRRRRRQLLRQMPPLDRLLRGSLIERYKPCGKPGCKCARGPGHGPKYYLSVSHYRQRPQMDYVPQDYHHEATELLANNQLPGKCFTIRRARNASMRCAGKRRNWVGAKLRSGL